GTPLFAFGLVASAALSASAQESVVDCLAAATDQHDTAVITHERFGNGMVAFVDVANVIEVLDGSDVTGKEIEVAWYPDASGCAAEPVDTFHYGGGEPVLEDSFIHTVHGEPNLFAIVSWPNSHAGLGMHGRMYSVYAYHEVDGDLVLNRAVAETRELAGGVEGSVEGGIPSSFEGVSREGVIGILKRLGLE